MALSWPAARQEMPFPRGERLLGRADAGLAARARAGPLPRFVNSFLGRAPWSLVGTFLPPCVRCTAGCMETETEARSLRPCPPSLPREEQHLWAVSAGRRAAGQPPSPKVELAESSCCYRVVWALATRPGCSRPLVLKLQSKNHLDECLRF